MCWEGGLSAGEAAREFPPFTEGSEVAHPQLRARKRLEREGTEAEGAKVSEAHR